MLLLFTGCLPWQAVFSQELSPRLRAEIGERLTTIARKEISVGKIKIDSVFTDEKELRLYANKNCSHIPFREKNVEYIYDEVRSLLPDKYTNLQLRIITDDCPIEELIPMSLRTRKDKKAKTFANRADGALITRLSAPHTPKYGLQNRHIALWQSHGYYYEAKRASWEWQRARAFQTVEDLYTQSYVLPYLTPMLENAGAYVLIPRERDVQAREVIVDNDGSRNGSYYTEKTAGESWHTGSEPGFACLRDRYIEFENPFREGTYRIARTIRKGRESVAEWVPDIPECGKYAVYVSYKSLPESTEDALYTVYHRGGESQFSVNQQMGGGTWIYLGHFAFAKGKNNDGKVVLSNKSSKAGKVVTADAIKIGGGYGNIARRADPSYPYESSGYPRFTEASRYWMQWAGMPDSIYSESRGENDYTDDYKSRGLWVNYLAGGSFANPGEEGLKIPVDMALAFHTDAGCTRNDSIIGTLGIFQTASYDGVFENGASRYLSRELTDLVQSTIVNDIRTLYEPKWSRRGMWNQSYFEARVPKVPTMLLELLSHQNFADMRYGLDPRFRFTVSRAVYKGILRFICAQNNTKYVVQPLPVDNMSLRFIAENRIELTWKPVDDPLEPTARADRYIVYTRTGDGDFDNGVVVESNSFSADISPGLVHSFRVTAINDGGESFPSEILSAARAFNEKGTVLVINGFDRISAPADFTGNGVAGFLDSHDHGVPDKIDISYVGSMKEFRRSAPWADDNTAGFGISWGNYETMVIAGNTFDYPAIHGAAILKAGYSFLSCSDEAIENGTTGMNEYKYTDLILGKERLTKMGRGGIVPLEFKTFSDEMQEAITNYTRSGGNIFVSGAFVGTDLWNREHTNQKDRDFATGVLKYRWKAERAAQNGKVKSVTSPFPCFTGEYTYYNELNPESYVVESPDAIEPVGEGSFTIFRYSENSLSAGIAHKGRYKTCITGFPFESLRSRAEREQMMESILTFFDDK